MVSYETNAHIDEIERLREGNLMDVVRMTARLYANRVAVGTYVANHGVQACATYRELWDDVRRSVTVMQDAYATGSHIMLVGDNGYDWFVLLCGIIGSGCVAIPLDARASEREIAQAARATDADAILSRDARGSTSIPLESFDAMMGRVRHTLAGELPTAGPCEAMRCSLMVGTSGSTSEPKYCMLSQRNMIAAALSLFHSMPVAEGGRVLSMLPLSHCFGLNLGMLYQLMCGSTIVMDVPQATYFDVLSSWKPQYIMCVPSVITALNTYARIADASMVEDVFSNLIDVFCGGAPITKEAAEEFMAHGTELLIGYGLTECSPTISMNAPGHASTDTVGVPCDLVEVRLVDGELQVHSPAVMLGYYKDPKATDLAMDGEWLRTGDLAYLDEWGRIVITGRKKSVIVLPTGENVGPEEIESLVLADERIEYCRVYALQGRLFADVYATGLSDEAVLQLMGQVNDTLAPHQRIMNWVVLHERPATTTLGKVVRRDHSSGSEGDPED